MEVVGKQPKRQGFNLKQRVMQFTAPTVKAGVRGQFSASRSPITPIRFAIALALGTLSGHAAALGLGVMTLHSSLGQPLLVDINLIDANGEADNRCFKASLSTIDGNRLGTVSFNVRTTDTTVQLYVSTREAINEPLALLSVESSCGTQTRRDYQILLDQQPALPTTDTPAAAVSPATPIAANGQKAGQTAGQNDATTSGTGETASGRKSHHHKDPNAAAPATPAVPASTEVAPVNPPTHQTAAEKRKAKNASKAFRSVLRLGSDPSVEDGLNGIDGMHLVLSHGLHGDNADLDVRPAPPAGVPTAASGDASAVPPGEPAVPAAGDLALKDLQDKITRLEQQTQELSKLNAKQQALLDQAQKEKEKEKESQSSFIYLYFLLFASFVAIGWLLWRTRQIQSGINRSWEDVVPENDEAAFGHVEDDDARREQEIDDFLNEPVAKPEPKMPVPMRPVVKVAEELPDLEPVASTVDFDRTVAMQRPKPEAAERSEAVESDYKFTNNIRTTLPDAEEILDEIQQAEFWMDMQQPQRAIEILESNWGIERPSSPLPWLYLFDLYRMVGDEDKYVELTERFERIFNGKVIAWEDGELMQHSRSLEDFPVLLKKIIQLWGEEDLVPFMENLLIDDRDGRRQGFDLAAFRDILFLTNIAYEIQSDPTKAAPAEIIAPEWSVLK